MALRFISIDPGVKNVGIALGTWSECETKLLSIDGIYHEDLTVFCHSTVDEAQCQLPHKASIGHRIAHFMQEWKREFDRADTILLEGQPPRSGGQCLEAVITCHYPAKVIFCFPAAIHSMFNLSRKRSERKDQTVQLIQDWIQEEGVTGGEAALKWLGGQEILYDPCDALLFVAYYLNKN